MVLGGITVVGGTSIYFMKNYKRDQFYNSRVIVQAIDVARNSSELKTLLGEPIKGGKVDVKDEKNFMNETKAHFEIPLVGKRHNATMLIDVLKEQEDWELDKVNILFKGKEEIIGQINIFKRSKIERDSGLESVNR